MKKSSSILILLLFLFLGCKKKETVEFTDTPIIQSYLYAGQYLTVNVSRQIPFSSNVAYSSDDINNLQINVSCNNITKVLTPTGNGNYVDSSSTATEGISYNLNFNYNSKNVKAYTYVPTQPQDMVLSAISMTIEQVTSTSTPTAMPTMPDPIKITWSNPDNSYYLIVVENMESTLEAIRDFGDKTPPGNVFKKSPTNSSGDELRSMDFQYYGKHRVILYHVLPDYAKLYESNNTNSQNLTNPSTSITNGYGIFTGLNSDTLYIEISK